MFYPNFKISIFSGIFGYTAYCATKFAVRGFAESLAMELTPHNVYVTLSMPPDTDTPGLAIEEQTKILETKLICQTASVIQPEVVADKILKDSAVSIDPSFYSFYML